MLIFILEQLTICRSFINFVVFRRLTYIYSELADPQKWLLQNTSILPQTMYVCVDLFKAHRTGFIISINAIPIFTVFKNNFQSIFFWAFVCSTQVKGSAADTSWGKRNWIHVI